MPPRTIPALASALVEGPITPQSDLSDKQPGPEIELPLTAPPAAADALNTNGFYSQNPDEKLLEAMQSPKDRFFLLKLEQQVIEFVQDSKEPFMDLPPSNSFCRMLTHKLADYYHMTHSFEPVPGAVRIYRTPFCRIPRSLSSIAVPSTTSSSPAPTVLPRKIMRRGEDGETASASAAPSKPNSEVGSDSKEKAVKEQLTREEREEAYNRARERIFGNADKTETGTPDGEDDHGVSRASSVSAKDRSASGAKRKPPKQRRDDSESFDTRSQYMVINGVQTPWPQASAQFYHMGNPHAYAAHHQQPYKQSLQPMYGPNQSFSQAMPPNAGYVPPYNVVPEYPPPPSPPQPVPPYAQQQQQRYPTPNPMGPPYHAPPQQVQQPAWSSQPQQIPSQKQYPAGSIAGNLAGSSPGPGPMGRLAGQSPAGLPYPFGQLPVNTNSNDPKSQHPIPGSYSRPSFNPMTQSFVPANGGMGMPPACGPYGTSSPGHGSPQMVNQSVSFSGYQPPLPASSGYAPPPLPLANYGMTHPGSNNGIGGYHAVQQRPTAGTMAPGFPPPRQLAQNHLPQGHHPLPIHLPHRPQNHIPAKPAVLQGPVDRNFSHLPTYGNPATLPQKPAM